MRRLAAAFFAAALFLAISTDCTDSAAQGGGVQVSLSALVGAYPDAGIVVESDRSDIFLSIDGHRMLFLSLSDPPEPDPGSPADQPICATLAQEYPAGEGGRDPAPGSDPGRVRNEFFLKLLYGADADSVRKNCVTVSFLGERVQFNGRHGAAGALARVGQRLEKLTEADPSLREYILPTSGTLNWRTVKGSNRLSPHSFAIAIDLNVKKAPYWQWSSRTSPEVKSAREGYPQAIVDAFEAEGFIWGGKWYSFDFMHYEYRPELLSGQLADLMLQ